MKTAWTIADGLIKGICIGLALYGVYGIIYQVLEAM